MNTTYRQLVLSLTFCGLLIKAGVPTVVSLAGQNLADPRRSEAVEPEKENIRDVISDSQSVETCTIYVKPVSFDRALLKKYWVPANKGGKSIVEIENAIGRLRYHRWHYGADCANEKFDIRSITIQPPGDVADVRTSERWYVPMIDQKGNVVIERPAFLEYEADYRLVKIDGRWLVFGGGRYRKD